MGSLKSDKKKRALSLRRCGRSIGSIAKELHVSKSSVSAWVSGVMLTAQQLEALERQNPASKSFVGQRSGTTLSERAKSKRKGFQSIGRSEVDNFSLHLAGCMLYWAEGSKDRNVIKLSNYDPELVSLFLRFLRLCFGVENENIKVYIAHYSDEQRAASEQFWLTHLSLPVSCLGNSKTIKSQPKKKTNRHQFGGCMVVVCNTMLVQRIFGSIKEYVGLTDSQKWL